MTMAEGSRRGSNRPATSPIQDATNDILELVGKRIMKHLRKATIPPRRHPGLMREPEHLCEKERP